MGRIITTCTNLFNVLIGDVHRVDEIIPGLHFSEMQLELIVFSGFLLFRGQGLLNFLKLLI